MANLIPPLIILFIGLIIALIYWLENRNNTRKQLVWKGVLVIISTSFLLSIVVFWLAQGVFGGFSLIPSLNSESTPSPTEDASAQVAQNTPTPMAVTEGSATDETEGETTDGSTEESATDGSTPTPAPVDTDTSSGGLTTHVIQPGDTVYSLSVLYGVSVDAIAAANKLDIQYTINVGQTLVIPGDDGAVPVLPIEPPPTSDTGTGSQPPNQVATLIDSNADYIEYFYNLKPNANIVINYAYSNISNLEEVMVASLFVPEATPESEFSHFEIVRLDEIPRNNINSTSSYAIYSASSYATGDMEIKAESEQFDLTLISSRTEQRFNVDDQNLKLFWAWDIQVKPGMEKRNGLVTINAYLQNFKNDPIWTRIFEIEINEPVTGIIPTPLTITLTPKPTITPTPKPTTIPSSPPTEGTDVNEDNEVNVVNGDGSVGGSGEDTPGLLTELSEILIPLFSIIAASLPVIASYLSFKQAKQNPSQPRPSTLNNSKQVRFYRYLDNYYSEQELRTLCLDLKVDYDDLPYLGQSNKARELVALMARNGQLNELETFIKRDRSFLFSDDASEIPDITTDENSIGPPVSTIS